MNSHPFVLKPPEDLCHSVWNHLETRTQLILKLCRWVVVWILMAIKNPNYKEIKLTDKGITESISKSNCGEDSECIFSSKRTKSSTFNIQRVWNLIDNLITKPSCGSSLVIVSLSAMILFDLWLRPHANTTLVWKQKNTKPRKWMKITNTYHPARQIFATYFEIRNLYIGECVFRNRSKVNRCLSLNNKVVDTKQPTRELLIQSLIFCNQMLHNPDAVKLHDSYIRRRSSISGVPCLRQSTVLRVDFWHLSSLDQTFWKE